MLMFTRWTQARSQSRAAETQFCSRYYLKRNTLLDIEVSVQQNVENVLSQKKILTFGIQKNTLTCGMWKTISLAAVWLFAGHDLTLSAAVWFACRMSRMTSSSWCTALALEATLLQADQLVHQLWPCQTSLTSARWPPRPMTLTSTLLPWWRLYYVQDCTLRLPGLPLWTQPKQELDQARRSPV